MTKRSLFRSLCRTPRAEKFRTQRSTGEDVHGKLKDGTAYQVTVPANYPHLFDVLQENHVAVTVKSDQGSSWLPILINFSPLIIIGALWFLHDAANAERRK